MSERRCSVAGCARPFLARGYCSAHYAYARRVQGLGLRQPSGCSVPGCANKHDAKGFCHAHYNRWKRHGDPTTTTRKPNGSGWVQHGYQYFTINGRRAREHVLVAERALGRKLPHGAVVHHVDEDRTNNTPSNLVICPSNKYHRLIHQRLDAYKASGHYHWRKCPYCRSYDDPANMRGEQSGRFVHRECSARARRIALAKGKANAIHVS